MIRPLLYGAAAMAVFVGIALFIVVLGSCLLNSQAPADDTGPAIDDPPDDTGTVPAGGLTPAVDWERHGRFVTLRTARGDQQP